MACCLLYYISLATVPKKHLKSEPDTKTTMGSKEIKCAHNLRQWNCRKCGGGGACEHKNNKYDCKKCWPKNFCECGKKKTKCAVHRPARKLCEHHRKPDICDHCIENELRIKLGIPAAVDAQNIPAAIKPNEACVQNNPDTPTEKLSETSPEALPKISKKIPLKTLPEHTKETAQKRAASPPPTTKKQRLLPGVQYARKSAPQPRKIIVISSEASDDWDVSYSTPCSSSEYVPDE